MEASPPAMADGAIPIDVTDGHFVSRISDHRQHQQAPSAPTQPSPNATAVLSSMFSLGDVATTLQLLGPSDAPFTPPPEQYSFGQHPIRFRPMPSTMAKDEMEYIQRRGATQIPPNPLRDEIIRCYIDHVHPYMPLLDAQDLLQLIDCSITGPVKTQYSILLFQCVMFAAVAFTNEHLVQDAGYTDIQAARKAFYLKTRVCLSCIQLSLQAHENRYYTIWTSRRITSRLFSASC